jgi:ADP-ribose pyrophosphatase YjhB (NUDIX family)
LPGGRQEIGESIMQCAFREAHEETGLSIGIERIVCVDSDPVDHAICVYPDETIIQYCNVTFLAWVLQGHLRLSDESTRVLWTTIKDLPEPFLPAHRWRLEQAFREDQKVVVR